MLACPKCHGTQINETTRQVRMLQADFGQALQRSLKFMFVGIIVGAAIVAVIVNSVASANSAAVGRFLAMGVGLLVFFGLLSIYLKQSGMRTLHVFTCTTCRKTWLQIAQKK